MDFKSPRRTPSQRGHLFRLADDYGRAHGIAADRTRRWLSIMSLLGALERVRAGDGPLFIVKGGVSIELRLGLRTRSTKDLDLVFRGDPHEMLDVLEDAFSHPYGSFGFRRKGPVDDIRETGSRRLSVQVTFGGRDWQTLQLEVAPPEADEIELVPAAISIADFKLDGPDRVACLSLRYQIAQKLHAVTEQPEGRPNLRYWDLIDLMLLRELGPDLARVREASVKIFERRASQPWPPDLVVRDGWREPYRADAIGIGLPDDVDVAASTIRGFIAEIDAAV